VERVSHLALDQRAGQRVAVAVAALGEETNVMALGANNDGNLGLRLHVLLKHCAQGSELPLHDMGKLALRYAVAQVKDVIGSAVVLAGPPTEDGGEHGVHVVRLYNLDTPAVGLDGSAVDSGIAIHRDTHGRDGRSARARRVAAMRHIDANHHGRRFEHGRMLLAHVRRDAAVLTAQFCVHLEADVGDILGVGLARLEGLDHLRRDGEATLGILFESLVQKRRLLAENEEYDLGRLLVVLASGRISPLNQLGVGHVRGRRKDVGLGLDPAAMVDPYLFELAAKVDKRGIVDGAVDRHQGPRAQGGRHVAEADATKIPAAPLLRVLGHGISRVVHVRVRKHASLHLGRLVGDGNTKLTQVGVAAPVEVLNHVQYLPLALGRSLHGKLNHLGRLLRVELEIVPVEAHNLTELHGEERALPRLDQRQIRVAKPDLVLLGIVVGDRDLLCLISTLDPPLKLSLAGAAAVWGGLEKELVNLELNATTIFVAVRDLKGEAA